MHILTSGWLEMGAYQARYVAPKEEADGLYAVLSYENGVGDNWIFKRVFTRAKERRPSSGM